jgi:hypothetical protein
MSRHMADMVGTRWPGTVPTVRRVLLGLLVSAAASLACHHDTDPPAHLEPGEVQPLPPSSGTPVGYLVDDAADLKLSDSQLDKLKEIDSVLANQLDEIETQLRSYNPPPSAGSNNSHMVGRRGGRMGGGGMGGGGMGGPSGGGMGGGGGGGHRGGGAGSGSGSGASAPPPRYAADIGKLTEERAADVRDAIAQAMAVLDPVQRVMARKLLDERGIDTDAGRPVAGSAAHGSGADDGGGGDDGAPLGSGEP